MRAHRTIERSSLRWSCRTTPASPGPDPLLERLPEAASSPPPFPPPSRSSLCERHTRESSPLALVDPVPRQEQHAHGKCSNVCAPGSRPSKGSGDARGRSQTRWLTQNRRTTDGRNQWSCEDSVRRRPPTKRSTGRLVKIGYAKSAIGRSGLDRVGVHIRAGTVRQVFVREAHRK
jgi:hypothetical protein